MSSEWRRGGPVYPSGEYWLGEKGLVVRSVSILSSSSSTGTGNNPSTPTPTIHRQTPLSPAATSSAPSTTTTSAASLHPDPNQNQAAESTTSDTSVSTLARSASFLAVAAPGPARTTSGSLRTTVHSLAALGLTRPHDIYVVLSADVHSRLKRKAKTSVIPRSRPLVWTPPCVIDIRLDFSSFLQIAVYNSKSLTRDEICATAMVDLLPFANGKVNDLIIPLKPQGEIHITLELNDESNLFGLDLEAACRRENKAIPSIVSLCIAEVERIGLNVVGIYRISGRSASMTTLRSELDAFLHSGELDLEKYRISEVAGILKQYFRELPEPLLTNDLSHLFMDAVQSCKHLTIAQQRKHIKSIVDRLPQTNRTVLAALMTHLKLVASHQNENKMNEANLAACWGPSLLYPASVRQAGTTPIVADVVTQNSVIEFLICHWPLTEESSATLACDGPSAAVVRRSSALGQHVDQEASLSLYRALFRRYDRHNKGTVDPEELAMMREEMALSDHEALETAAQDASAISFDVFVKLLQANEAKEKNHWSTYGRSKKRTKPKSKTLWEQYGSTPSGAISYDQFRAICYQLGHVLSDEEFKMVTLLLDSTGSGTISYAEFFDWYEHENALENLHLSQHDLKQLRTALYFFSEHDKDCNYLIPVEEFPPLYNALVAANYKLAPLDEVVAELDKDQNGQISFSEYARYLNKNSLLTLESRIAETNLL